MKHLFLHNGDQTAELMVEDDAMQEFIDKFTSRGWVLDSVQNHDPEPPPNYGGTA